MLIETLKKYDVACDNLWKDLRDDKKVKYFIEHTDVSLATSLLENLIKLELYEYKLVVYEIMLKINKNRALTLIKDLYLSQDLSNHANDQVTDLKSMFSDIKNILGKKELNKILKLNCWKFLPKNKKNRRVKEAIRFALDND